MKHNQMIHKDSFSFINHIGGWKDIFFGVGYTKHTRVRLWCHGQRKSLEYVKGSKRLTKAFEYELKNNLPCVH